VRCRRVRARYRAAGRTRPHRDFVASPRRIAFGAMFVFKAAVLGAGTMGGEIAQVIASADIPVVMKDVKQDLVDAGLEKAREVTQGQLASLVAKEKISSE